MDPRTELCASRMLDIIERMKEGYTVQVVGEDMGRTFVVYFTSDDDYENVVRNEFIECFDPDEDDVEYFMGNFEVIVEFSL